VNALKVAVAMEELGADPSPDDLDTIETARSVAASITCNGWSAQRILLGRDGEAFAAELAGSAPDVVFNLVESFGGQASLAGVAPAMCRRAHVACTGSGEGALAAAADKAMASRLMAAAGIPVPENAGLSDLRRGRFPGPGAYIVKSRFEDASLGLDDDCVVDAEGPSELLREMERLAPRMGGDCVAERFVAGREFNLALLAGTDGDVRALPLAEMVFDPAMPGPAILGYAAKWHPDSPVFAASVRSFDLPDNGEMGAAMVRIGLRCWEVFGFEGYARVDFRVTRDGRPLVIDLNPNPCIAPDSGFMAAAAQAGLDHADVVRAIVFDALRRAGRKEAGHV
jgi:D-alanine-D-alanine ligase